jgi:hypothetical protein
MIAARRAAGATDAGDGTSRDVHRVARSDSKRGDSWVPVALAGVLVVLVILFWLAGK